MKPTENQKKLFDLLSDFVVDTIISLISAAKDRFGMVILRGDALIELIAGPLEAYFNECAMLLQSRTDEYINNKFDAMTKIKLDNTNHPIDLLNNIVMLSLYTIQIMDLGRLVSDNIPATMTAIRIHLKSIVAQKEVLATSLHGCDESHDHQPIKSKVYNFTANNYTEYEGKQVKLSNI